MADRKVTASLTTLGRVGSGRFLIVAIRNATSVPSHSPPDENGISTIIDFKVGDHLDEIEVDGLRVEFAIKLVVRR